MPEGERPAAVPGPAGIALSANDWLFIGLFGAVLVVAISVLLLPVGPFSHALDGLPYKDYVGVLLALVAGCFAGLGLGQWWDFRPGGPGWRNRPPPVRPGSTGIQGASSFEIYTPPTARPPKKR